VCGAQELIDRLLEQVKPFNAKFHWVRRSPKCAAARRQDSCGHERRHPLDAGAVVIAAGVGSFQPRRLAFEGSSSSRAAASIIASSRRRFSRPRSGDLRRRRFGARLDRGAVREGALADAGAPARGISRAPATVARMRELVAAGKMQLFEGHVVAMHSDNQQARRRGAEEQRRTDDLQVPADHVLAFYGLHPEAGPGRRLGPRAGEKALKVDTENFQTSVPGIFAIGDINTYPGKKKLILSGFHEAALAAFAIQHHLFPEKRQFLQYTTTSPIMQKRLGVGGDSH
jgi:thioredoxin reductase (NADPH)